MGKLFRLKEWLTVPEATKYLSIVLGEVFTEADVLRLALDGHLTISTYFVNVGFAKMGRIVPVQEASYDQIHGPAGFRTLLQKGFEIGGGRRVVEICEEVAFIEGVWDLLMIGSEIAFVEQKYQALTNGPEVTKIPKGGAFLSRENCVACQLWNNSGNNIPADLSDDAVLVIRTGALTKLEESLHEQPIQEHGTDRSHVSNKLAYLNQAARKFWGNVERSDPTTHTKNVDVISWLVEHGFSSTLAASAASIIRPEWATIGRPPEK